MAKLKKVLITGASGFIGRNIAEQWSGKYDIFCPSSTELNLMDTESVRIYLERHMFDYVIHSAVCNSTRKQITAYQDLDGNLRMFFNLERCQEFYGKMYYFGSGAEYDRRYYIPDMQETRLGFSIPKDAYGLSKYVMAKICEKSQNIYEFCLFGVFGKYEEWERRFISNAICRILKGMDIKIYQNVYFDYLWVQDLAGILEWFLNHEPEYKRYHICRGQKIDLYSIAIMVKEILDSDCDIIVEEPGWKLEYTGNNHRLLQETGMYCFTDFKKSVRELCDFYKSNIDMIDITKLS